MKHIFKAIALFIIIALAGCQEEDSAIRLAVVSNSNPEQISWDYYSIDPQCLPQQYFLCASDAAGDIELACKNYSQLAVEAKYSQNDSLFTVSVDNNQVKIHLNAIDSTDYRAGWIRLVAMDDSENVRTTITIERFYMPDNIK